MTTTERVRLAEYTTLRLGGPAARFSVAATEEELVAAVAAADREGEPVLVLGGGSNLVVGDAGFCGVVVRAACRGAAFAADGGAVEVTAAAGQDWDELVCQCLAEGLSGVECLSGIPGTAGATPIQNVGAYGQEVAEVITAVRAYDRLTGQVARLGPADLDFGYRTSMFKRQVAEASRQAAEASRQAAEAARRPARASRQAAEAARRPARASRQAAGASRRAATDGRPESAAGDRPSGDGDARSGSVVAATGRFVVLDVTFRLPQSSMSAPVRYTELARVLGVAEGARVPAAAARSAVLELRRGKGMVLDDGDPDTRSAGSFFTNPVVPAERLGELSAEMDGGASVPHWPAGDSQIKLSAAWLIERAGFSRGFRLADDPEGARISTKHTLALINPGDATTAGLIRLARTIRDGVRSRFGVELTSEPTLVGVTL